MVFAERLAAAESFLLHPWRGPRSSPGSEGSDTIELLAFQVALDWMVAGLLSAIFGALMLAVGLPMRLQWVRMVRDE